MPETSADTRSELVTVATELVMTRGFASFSFQDLADRVGIRKASIHYHFPSKADLGVAVVAAAHGDVRERLRALLGGVKGMAACGDRICPIGSLQAEYGALPAPIQDALRAFDVECVDTYARWLTEGRARSELRFPGDPRALATCFAALMQAVLQRHRSNPAENAGAALDQFLLLITS